MGRESVRRAPLVGRGELIARAMRLFTHIRTGGVALFIRGDPGVGKTRLVDHLLDAASLRELPVLRAAAAELEATVPFATTARLLGLRPDSDDTRAAALGRLLADPDGRAPDHLQIADGVVDLLEHRSRDRPAVVVVDDLQWADGASLRVLGRLAAELDHVPVLLLLAARAAPSSQELGALERTVRALARGHVVHLDPLSEDDALELARALLAAEPGPRLRQAIAATGGNPLYVVELVSVVTRSGLVEEVDLPDDEVLPGSLRDLVVHHLDQLPGATREVLQVAAVVGPTFDLRHLTAVLDRDELGLVADLQPALDAGVLVARDDRLAFAHDLMQEALYQAQPGPIREAVHRSVVAALNRAGVPVIDVVPHLLRVDWSTVPDAPHVLHGAAMAMRARSAEVAADLVRAALEVAGPDVDPRWQRDAMEMFLLADRHDDMVGVLRALAQRPLEVFDTEVRDDLVAATVWLGDRDLPFDDQDALLRRVEAAGLGPVGQARVQWRRAWLLWQVARRDESRALAQQALAQAVELGAHDIARDAELVLVRLLERDGQPEDLFAHAARALEHARRVDDPLGFVNTALTFALVHGNWSGTREDAERAIQEAGGVAARSGSPFLQAVVDGIAGVHAARWGPWPEAVVRLEACLAVLDGYVDLLPVVIAQVPARAARLHAHRGDLSRAEERLAHAQRLVPPGDDVPSADELMLVDVATIEIALCGGDAARAVAAVDHFVEFVERRGVPRYVVYYAPLLVHANLAAGQRDRAEHLVARAHTLLDPSVEPRLLLTLERVQARLDGDADRLVALIPDVDAQGIPFEFSPQVREEAAEVLLQVGRTEEAVHVLEEALRLWDQAEARHDVDRVRAALRDLGVHRGRGPATDRPDTGWEAITEAEWRVIRLVAEGLTYREIGERLFISRRTVESHVRNVFRKLDLSSRGELVARLLHPEGRRWLDPPTPPP